MDVFEKFLSWSFNLLPPIYINSPFISFDKSVIPLLKNDTSLHSIDRTNQEENCADSIKSIETKTKLESLPARIKRKISSFGIFSEYLKEWEAKTCKPKP